MKTLPSSTAKPATFPAWIYDGSTIEDPFGYGERAVNFIRNLRHPKSTGRYKLDPWQERIVRRIYGPRHPDGTRIVKTAFIMVGRGARKTSLGAVLTLLHLIGPEKIAGGQIVCAAADQKQATIAFDESASILREDKRLARLVKVSDHFKRIKHLGNGGKVEAVSADGATSHGRTPTFVLADEIHVWRNRSLWEALRTGLIKTPGSLQIITTTAGKGQTNIGFEAYDYARKVALGEIVDPATLPVIFECAPDCDWQDEAQWHLANPGLTHGYPDLAGLRQLAREATQRPGERESFRQLHLNIWLDGAASPWLDMQLFDGGSTPVDFEGRRGEAAWIGVDLASTSDLTSVCVALRDDDGGFSLIPYAFAPEASLRRRQDRGDAPYATWAADKHLIATPGNVTDWQVVEDKIRELCEHFSVEEICFDPWCAQQLMNRLLDDGLPAVEHRQGFISMTAPMKSFERNVLSGLVRHGGHPVLRWCVSNLVADEDPAGNLKPNKRRSKEKIDVAVAAIMALGRADTGETIAASTTPPSAKGCSSSKEKD